MLGTLNAKKVALNTRLTNGSKCLTVKNDSKRQTVDATLNVKMRTIAMNTRSGEEMMKALNAKTEKR